MKKTKKLVGLVTLLFAAGSIMAACGGNNEGGDTSGNTPASSSVHKHKYVEDKDASVAATCTSEGKKVTKCECGDVKETKVSKAAHTWEDIEGGKAATCTEAGEQKQKCKVCGEEQSVEIEALGHDWGETVWSSQPTCDTAGEGVQSCTRCDATNPQTQEALGHNYVTNDTAEPDPGYAAVRVYQCENGCEQSALGFKANEVTEDSKSHLTIGEDGGAAFWGRPIGNNLELDENGTSVNQEVGELVFDETQTGDFFEYKFKLTAAQVAQLGGAQKLYCDAKPAGYMGQNNVDFWAYGADSSDWTPGAYIDGERKGELVDDFRYVLYVDGERKDMDATVRTPVRRGDPRAEYVLPYTFKLHEGENSIRLVMSGGYRSTFYNFTFRSAEAPADDPVDPTPAKTYEYTAAECTEGQKAPVASDKNTRLGKGIFDDVWSVEGVEAGKYDVYLNAQVSAGNASKGCWNSAYAINELGDKASNNGSTAELQNDYKYKIKVDDGAYVNLGPADKSYGDTGLSESAAGWTNVALAQIDIAAGAKTITVHNMDNGYSIWVFGIRLVKVA